MRQMSGKNERHDGGVSALNIIHIMKDGTERKSIEGVVIQSEDFYRVLHGIMESKAVSE